jgi:dTDP-D-glucose 4,6-dehydratase
VLIVATAVLTEPEIYNIAASQDDRSPLSIAHDLISIFIPDSSQDKHDTLLKHIPDRLFNDARYAIDGSKILRDTKWTGPQTSWNDGLRKTVGWYRVHGKGWWSENKC